MAVISGSKQQISEWIQERDQRPDTEILPFHLVECFFPKGPPTPRGDWVDIVAVTPESEC